jgi:hypothetical protein
MSNNVRKWIHIEELTCYETIGNLACMQAEAFMKVGKSKILECNILSETGFSKKA